MSTFDPIEDLDAVQVEQQRSGLAVTSLICSLIICCPITTILGPLLGVIALFRLKSRPHLTGKGFAISGIAVGIITTLIWVVLSIYTSKFIMGFVEQTNRISTDSIQAGYDGNYDEFRGYLSRSSDDATDAEIKSFITVLEERFGKFDSAFLNMEEQKQEIQQTAQEVPIPVRFIFETKDTTGYITFEFIPGTGFNYEMKIGCIKIKDAKNGDIIFPIDSICAPAKTSSEESDDTSLSP